MGQYAGERKARNAEKREQAEARQAVHAARSAKERLGVLMDRGHGHCAEAQALAEWIAAGGE